jgi:thiol:disulfide interchange protein DsbA
VELASRITVCDSNAGPERRTEDLQMTNNPISVILLAAVAGLFASAAQAQPYEAGVHYEVIEQPVGYREDQPVEVTEVFSYLCNHCMTFESYVQPWKQQLPEDVEFNRVHVNWGSAAGLYARAFVTASTLGVEEQAHVALMDEIWKEQRRMRSLEELADFYAGYGVDPDRFLATAKSFAVDMRMKREQQRVVEYQVNGTPAMVVNGKYRISPGGAITSFNTMLDVVNYLVEQELTAQ